MCIPDFRTHPTIGDIGRMSPRCPENQVISDGGSDLMFNIPRNHGQFMSTSPQNPCKTIILFQLRLVPSLIIPCTLQAGNVKLGKSWKIHENPPSTVHTCTHTHTHHTRARAQICLQRVQMSYCHNGWTQTQREHVCV